MKSAVIIILLIIPWVVVRHESTTEPPRPTKAVVASKSLRHMHMVARDVLKEEDVEKLVVYDRVHRPGRQVLATIDDTEAIQAFVKAFREGAVWKPEHSGVGGITHGIAVKVRGGKLLEYYLHIQNEMSGQVSIGGLDRYQGNVSMVALCHSHALYTWLNEHDLLQSSE